MVVRARGSEGFSVEVVLLALAEAVRDGCLVGQPVVEVEVDDGVAAKLCMERVVVDTRGVDVLTKVGIGVVVADGLVDVMLDVGMDVEGHADVDVGEAVADVAGVGGVAESG